MQTNTTNNQRAFIIVGTCLAWFSLISQFYLIIQNRQADILETVFRYFGYFTILTNILVALCFSALLFKQNSFFHRSTTQTAIAAYIFLVALIYNTVLRGIVKPEGFDRVVDESLHVVMPLLFIIYWFIYTDKKPLQWKHIFPWLIYPLVYIIYTLLRGSFAHFYPYPFLNVDQLGYQSVLINCIWVSLAFLLFSLLFIAIGKGMSKTK
ncbi:MAG: Pr6Pr family membrane protein [Taibaiella sp.]|jgi:hypothetical protein